MTSRLKPLPAPAVGFIGWSNSGKTTRICEVLRNPMFHGWRLGVIKHCHHPISKKSGSDTEKYRQAGASVVLPWYAEDLTDPAVADRALADAREALSLEPLDGILVEGFKQATYPKLWIGNTAEYRYGDTTPRVTFLNDTSRTASWVRSILWKERPLRGGILVGGRSSRMGLPKNLLAINGVRLESILEHSVSDLIGFPVLIGGELEDVNHGPEARIDDAPEVKGPIAGLLAALRADRHCTWMILPCDTPCWISAAARWLFSQRDPTFGVVAPIFNGHRQPFPSIIEPGLLEDLERYVESGASSPRVWLESRADVRWVAVPPEHQEAFQSANTPEEWKALTGADPTVA